MKKRSAKSFYAVFAVALLVVGLVSVAGIASAVNPTADHVSYSISALHDLVLGMDYTKSYSDYVAVVNVGAVYTGDDVSEATQINGIWVNSEGNGIGVRFNTTVGAGYWNVSYHTVTSNTMGAVVDITGNDYRSVSYPSYAYVENNGTNFKAYIGATEVYDAGSDSYTPLTSASCGFIGASADFSGNVTLTVSDWSAMGGSLLVIGAIMPAMMGMMMIGAIMGLMGGLFKKFRM